MMCPHKHLDVLGKTHRCFFIQDRGRFIRSLILFLNSSGSFTKFPGSGSAFPPWKIFLLTGNHELPD
jgi:hypothetical protein